MIIFSRHEQNIYCYVHLCLPILSKLFNRFGVINLNFKCMRIIQIVWKILLIIFFSFSLSLSFFLCITKIYLECRMLTEQLFRNSVVVLLKYIYYEYTQTFYLKLILVTMIGKTSYLLLHGHNLIIFIICTVYCNPI